MEIKTWVIGKVDLGELKWEEFLELLFPNQPRMRECAAKILNYVKQKPSTMNEIINNEKLPRGTAYDTFAVLKRFGLVYRKDKYSELVISEQFSLALERLSKYWKQWAQGKAK